ncbi:unnamed protein product, partial [Urochloa humidicola]
RPPLFLPHARDPLLCLPLPSPPSPFRSPLTASVRSDGRARRGTPHESWQRGGTGGGSAKQGKAAAAGSGARGWQDLAALESARRGAGIRQGVGGEIRIW